MADHIHTKVCYTEILNQKYLYVLRSDHHSCSYLLWIFFFNNEEYYFTLGERSNQSDFKEIMNTSFQLMPEQ